jgi:hypothetical protein
MSLGLGILAGIGGLISGGLNILGGIANINAQRAQANHQLTLLNQGMTRDENAYNNARKNEQLQWEEAQNQAFQRADDTEEMAKLGYSGTMEQTYLGNLQAAAGLADMAQQNKANLDQFGAAQGASGAKQNTRYSDILGEQMAAQQDLARTVTERGTVNQVNQAQGQFDQSMRGIANLRASYSQGGGQYNLYQHRLNSMQQAYNDNNAINQTQKSYMQDMIKQNSLDLFEGGEFNGQALFNWGSILFGGATAGLNTGANVWNWTTGGGKTK